MVYSGSTLVNAAILHLRRPDTFSKNPGENVFRAYSDVLRRRNVSTALSNFIVPVIYYSKRKLV